MGAPPLACAAIGEGHCALTNQTNNKTKATPLRCRLRRCSAVHWNPEVATQLIVASDDDASPTLKLWDLRNSMSPLKEFHGHTKVGGREFGEEPGEMGGGGPFSQVTWPCF